MKRKRKELCPSPLLDEIPKRTKVHAQRKFAQGSNINGPLLTPVREFERTDRSDLNLIPEPVELLPIRRQNTEDFLTFLCFRGTPILPPKLNFFNTASIVDNNGQVHEIKSESPKNGPIDTSIIPKAGSGSSERPFIAFGVRKRADPIVISKQMERKRRHALALQALRRKYQEQKMAKIRAVTISKLSEKPSNRATARLNTVLKVEKNTPTATNKPIAPKNKVKILSSKTLSSQTLRNINPKIKPRMCLRSFRGRFVQQELPFRAVKKNKLPEKKVIKASIKKKLEVKRNIRTSLKVDPQKKEVSRKKDQNDVKKKVGTSKSEKNEETRVTRSSKIILKPKLNGKKIIKRRIIERIIVPSSNLVKSRVLRSQTVKTNIASNQRLTRRPLNRNIDKKPKVVKGTESDQTLKQSKKTEDRDYQSTNLKKNEKLKKKSSKVEGENEGPVKVVQTINRILRKDNNKIQSEKSSEIGKTNVLASNKEMIKENKPDSKRDRQKTEEIEVNTKLDPEDVKNAKIFKKNIASRKCNSGNKEITTRSMKSPTAEENCKQRPSRKTKEAAAIYMEILSHKLVEGNKVDDDAVSIDSYPELPNVKKTEQRENELKANATKPKIGRTCEMQEKVCNIKKTETFLAENNKNISDPSENHPNQSKKADIKLQKQKNEKKIEESSIKIENKTENLKKVKSENEIPDSKFDIKSEDKKYNKIIVNSQKDLQKCEEIKEVKMEFKEKELEKDKTNHNISSFKTYEETLKTKMLGKSVSTKSTENSKIIKEDIEDKRGFPVESQSSKNPQVFEQKIYKKLNTKDSSDSDECLAKIPQSSKTKLNIEKKDIKTKETVLKKTTENSSSDSENECLAKIRKIKNDETNKPHKHKKMDEDVEKGKKKLNKSKTSSLRVKSGLDTTYAHSDTSSKSTRNKSKKLTVTNFSDSDEEPLSKLTAVKKSNKKTTEELKEDILRKQKALIESPPRNRSKKLTKHKEKETVTKGKSEELPVKQKRECAKLPSNYLPMFSSSDDEEKFFHGFSPKNEKKKESIYSHSSLDFLSKGLGRRFGKEKVNMSNEQIEKWLKDSAMAGDDSKKAEEIKYCEEIPMETSPNKLVNNSQESKSSFLEPLGFSESKNITPEKKHDSTDDNLKSPLYKSPDRKPIFKKERMKAPPTVGAFSANNESSIYAFEEDVEDTISTPFRRPSRRPSSTATSRSEDELLKIEDQPKYSQFRKPVLKSEEPKSKETEPNSKQGQKSGQKSMASRNPLGKHLKKSISDSFDDFKYKVPSSPSASSSSSAKLYKRQNKNKSKPVENCNVVSMADFPCNGPGELVEAPTFYPTEKEFQDPLEYIEKLGSKAEQFGICKIVPPSTFKPECKVSDDMRFTSYNQYVHKMLHRWGPNFKELMAIRNYLQTQNINLKQPPWIGGMEIDLPRLYQTVQSLGGLKEVIEKEKWSKVSDIMRIPKSAQDRVTKLDDIYCKYLLPYDTLSPDEREKLLDEVETAWAKRESRTLSKMQKIDDNAENESDSDSDNEIDECITKGRNMALNAFYRIARNTMSMWFRSSEPSVQDIEQEFWKHVVQRENHICVHSGSIDSGSYGYGFAVSKNSPFARHAWNLKVLTNNSGSVLRSLGPVMGVTVPTLHVGMVFSACCWYRDPHSLPWIEYLHTGGKKIWYGIPNSVGDIFQKALTKLVPNYCRNQGIWLPSDTVMLPPSLLIESGVPLCRIVQEPGEFIVVFPKAFTSSISTGYVVSESVFFAPSSWLKTAQMTFDLLKESCEPSMFSLERLYLSIINDQRTNVDVLKQMIPIVSSVHSKEKLKREKLQLLGVNAVECLPPPEAPNTKRKKKTQEVGDYECEICRTNLFISSVLEKLENVNYCLDHAIEQIENKTILPDNCKLLYTYSESDLEGLVSKINITIEQKSQKKVFNKFSGMPTLLNK